MVAIVDPTTAIREPEVTAQAVALLPASHFEPFTIGRPSLRVSREEGSSVLWLTGEHDIATMPAVRLALIDLIAHDDCDIVVDVGEATFVGLAVIGELERARRHLYQRGGWLTVRSPSSYVRRTFEICDADRLFGHRTA